MSSEFDVVVIGGGIAGLTAGMSSARLGRSTLILIGDIIGGQLVSIEKIEGFPGFPEGAPGYDLCPITQEQAEAAGAEFMMAKAEGVAANGDGWLVKTSERDVTTRAVVIATGSSLKKLGVPGEERLFGKGVSHCASCDAPLLRGKTAVVVGGGDFAMQEALTLAAHAAKVVMVQRDSELTGQKSYADRVRSESKIEIHFDTTVAEILGEDGVTGVRTQHAKTGATADIATHAVFAYVGLTPNTAFLGDLVALDPREAIETDDLTRTTLAGLCAVGGVRARSAHRAVGAAGDGVSAAVAIEDFLANGAWRK